MSKSPEIIIKPDDDYAPLIDTYNRGGVIAYPTETFYALGCDPYSDEAVAGLFNLKGRSFDKPIPLIVGSIDMLNRVAGNVSSGYEKLISRYWPGPLTIIVEAADGLAEAITGGSGKVAVRIPGSKEALRLVTKINGPITSTSANPSKSAPARDAKELVEYFDGTIDAILDDGRLAKSEASTIIEINGESLKVIREGVIPGAEINSVFGKQER